MGWWQTFAKECVKSLKTISGEKGNENQTEYGHL